MQQSLGLLLSVMVSVHGFVSKKRCDWDGKLPDYKGENQSIPIKPEESPKRNDVYLIGR